MIFETNMSQYFNEQIYNDMKQSEFTFPTIEFNGYGTSAKVAGLSHIFNSEQVDEIENACGKSVYFNHVVTELIKQRSEDQTVSQILTLSDTAFLKLKRQFENRLNKLYTHHLLGDLLDTQEIDFNLMHVLEELVRLQRRGVPFAAHTIYARNELMRKPVMRALLDSNILWKSKYFEYFHIEHMLYAQVAEEWLA